MGDKLQKIAAHGLIKRNGKYLVTRRSISNDYKPGEWDLPGGTIKFGEDPIKALKREIFEETKLRVRVGKPEFIYSYVSDPKRHQFQIVYACDYVRGSVGLDPKEHDKFIWSSIGDIAKLRKIAFLENFLKKR